MIYIIVDLDGTLSNCDHRRHLARKGKWDEFFKRCYEDSGQWPVIHTVNALRQYLPREQYQIVIFSGRSDIVAERTEDWLDYFNVQYDELFMREEGDYTPDDILKKQMLDELLQEEDSVLMCIDDRQKVVDMWRSLNIMTFQVAPGDF